MSYITLIRHGQANTHAKSEAEYDRLSELGYQQATWLGEHLREVRDFHNRLYTGTLKRHLETSDGMATELDRVEDPRLNELEYFTMAQAFEAEHGVPAPTDPADFVHHFPIVLQAWNEDRIEGAPERFAEFEARIRDVLAEISAGEGPALVVTSGGVIAMAMRLQMGLDIPTMAKLGLAIFNSSMHRLHPVGGVWAPALFNAVPHLDAPARHYAKTHV